MQILKILPYLFSHENNDFNILDNFELNDINKFLEKHAIVED